MKTCMVTLLLCCGLCVTAWAHPPRLYMGGSLQGNAVKESYRVASWSDVPPTGILYTGIGYQVESGIAGNCWGVYLGFRQDLSSYERTLRTYYEDDRWRGERFLLGARIHVSDEYANPVKPLLGAGITYGWAQRRLESGYPEEAMGKVPVEESARASFGWLVEGGFLIKVHSQWFISLIGRIETLNTQFGDQSRYGSVRNAGQGALQVGVMYEFNRGIAL